jgi:predicted porin
MRILAAIPAALLASGALAQTSPPPPTPGGEPAPSAAAPVAPAPAPAPKQKEEKGFVVVGERSKISLSGRAWASVENVRADSGSSPTGVEAKARNRVSNNSSYFHVEGEYTLAAGWAAIAQIEAEFGIEGENGLPFSGTRNTGVGLRGPIGSVILGRWDSPTKQTTIGLDPFGGTGIFGYYNVFGQQQTSATGQGANRWDRRLNNSINYTSPSFSGFKVLAAYSVGETPTVTPTTGPAISVSPWTASAALHYRSGPLYAGVAYERRNDCGNPDADAPGGASCSNAALGSKDQPNGTDQAVRVGVGYTIKPTFTKLGAAYEHIDLEVDALGTAVKKSLKRDVYWGTITQGLGTDTHQLILNYGFATDVSGSGVFADNKDTGAWYLTAAYRFWASKTTDLYVGYTTIKNRKNATYRIGSGNFGNVAVGSTTQGFGAGLRFMF